MGALCCGRAAPAEVPEAETTDSDELSTQRESSMYPRRKTFAGFDLENSFQCMTSYETTSIRPFTEAEIEVLRFGMYRVTHKTTVVDFGMSLFTQVFTSFPYMREWFPEYRTSPREMWSDNQMVVHGVTVMRCLESYVDFLNQPETFVALIETMAVYHLERAVTAKDMERFLQCLFRQLKIVAGKRCTGRRERTWIRFFDTHNAIYRRMEEQWMFTKIDGNGQFYMDPLPLIDAKSTNSIEL